MKWKSLSLSIMALAGAVAVSSCASRPVIVSPQPATSFQTLGHTEGNACGSLGIFGTAYYGIPMGLNGRVDKAYKEAVAKVPGATGLINVTMQENWYWWLFATARCVTISGEAVK